MCRVARRPPAGSTAGPWSPPFAVVIGLVAGRPAVAVWVVGTDRVGGELREQALPIPLADAGGPGQAGTGRGLPGRQLGLVDRPDPGTSTKLCALIRTARLGCG